MTTRSWNGTHPVRLRGLRESRDVLDHHRGLVTVFVCQLRWLMIDEENGAILRCQKSIETEFRERVHRVFLPNELALVGSHGNASPKNILSRLKTKSLSSRSSSPGSIFYLVDPPSDMERAIFELDAIGLAAAEKFDGILVDECHVPQIQNQLLPRCLDREQLLKLLDILCFDPAAECEQNLAVPCSPSS